MRSREERKRGQEIEALRKGFSFFILRMFYLFCFNFIFILFWFYFYCFIYFILFYLILILFCSLILFQGYVTVPLLALTMKSRSWLLLYIVIVSPNKLLLFSRLPSISLFSLSPSLSFFFLFVFCSSLPVYNQCLPSSLHLSSNLIYRF